MRQWGGVSAAIPNNTGHLPLFVFIRCHELNRRITVHQFHPSLGLAQKGAVWTVKGTVEGEGPAAPRGSGDTQRRRLPGPGHYDLQSVGGRVSLYWNISLKIRPMDPLGSSTRRMVASVGAMSFSAIFSWYSPARMPSPMKITGTCES